MSALERTLGEIESATALIAAPAEHLPTVREAMALRQSAIAELSELVNAHTFSDAEREDALRRLRLISEAGDTAEQWLVGVKSDALAEWNQWSHIYRALGAASASKPTVVDCRG